MKEQREFLEIPLKKYFNSLSTKETTELKDHGEGVILSVAKYLSGCMAVGGLANCEILRYTQDDPVGI